MVAYKGQTQTSQQYTAWEGLIRAACASAAAQPAVVIQAVTVSHRTDQLSTEALEAIIGFARGLAHDLSLDLETEESTGRLVLRFSRRSAAEPDAPEAVPFAPDIKALWHRLVWQRRE